MIVELFKYLSTPCPPEARAVGLLHELIALEARFKRCRAAWAGHVAACRETVLAAAALAKGSELAVVAGSGLLIEVPLAELAARFRRVVLLDLLHMGRVRREAAKYPNVELGTLDLTGVLAKVLTAAKARDRVPMPAPDALGPDALAEAGIEGAERPDLVVSANILSQLPLFPVARLEAARVGRLPWRRAPAYDAGEIEAFAAGLIASHLRWLEGFADRGSTACLITDVERLAVVGERVIERSDLLRGVRLAVRGAARREWVWDIAPSPESGGRHDHRRRVVGIPDIGERCR